MAASRDRADRADRGRRAGRRVTRPRRRPGNVAELTYQTSDRNGQNVAMTAAAQILSSKKLQREGSRAQAKNASYPWQKDAWSMYDEIGELWFSINNMANALSRVRLVAARITDDSSEPEPVTDGVAAELVADWAGGPPGQAEFLKRCGAHLGLVGDSYIVGRTLTGGRDAEQAEPLSPGRDGGDGSTQTWMAYSTEETRYEQGKWVVDDGAGAVEIGPDDLIIRCWRPHPRRYQEAESAVRAAMPVLRELRSLTMHVQAQVDSRLAGAGILVLPESITFSSTNQSGDTEDGEDPFINELMEMMVTPLRDRDSAAAVVPLVIRVPDDAVGKVEHISFSGQLDSQARELRDEAIRRLALNMDQPPEVLLGMSDSNHWSAWLIDEATVRLSIAPMAATICLALTLGWYQDALEEAGVDNAGDYMVWFDTTVLEQRPDRSGDAKDLYDRFVVGPDTLRREAGFGEGDAPEPTELTQMIALSLLERATDIRPLLEALGVTDIDVGPVPLPAPGSPDEDEDESGDGGGDDRSLPDRPDEPPDADARTAAAPPVCEPCENVLQATHVAVLRALEAVGNRMITRAQRGELLPRPSWIRHVHMPIGEAAIDRHMDGVWALLEEAVPGRPDVVAVADGYVRELLAAGQPHELRTLRAAFRQAGLQP